MPETAPRGDARLNARRAIEALRAGVPNRDVVRLLPPEQPAVTRRFEALLSALSSGGKESALPNGLLLEGDFGTGKSHWLEFFRHRALEENFLVSRVVLNKETPLHDANLLFRACANAAEAPDRTGSALIELAHSYETDKAPGFRDLYEWVHRGEDGLDPRLAATLYLFERTADEEVREKIVGEWAGSPMTVSELRAALKAVGADANSYRISRPTPTSAPQRFEFLSRFFRSAGYAGWILLFDETEMISRYSLRQRARSYAHLAALMNLTPGGVGGIASVFTITKDYTGQVLLGRKNDIVDLPTRLAGTCDAPLVPAAEIGMRAIQLKGTDLRPPTPEQVRAIHERVRALYADAYGGTPPESESRREYLSSTGWRQYVRTWITTWDLKRLYNYQATTVAEEVTVSYEEDADLQTPPSLEE